MGFGWLWTAWQHLSRGRPVRGGEMGPVVPMPVPWQHVEDYSERFAPTLGDRELLRALVPRLDTTYLQLEMERIKGEVATKPHPLADKPPQQEAGPMAKPELPPMPKVRRRGH